MRMSPPSIRLARCASFFLGIACLFGSNLPGTHGCTNIIVTPGASEDGSAMLGYNADDTELFGLLFHYPAGAANDEDNVTGTDRDGPTATAAPVRKIYEWETGRYLGSIPEVPSTHNVIGNCNDRGLCIGETSFGGIPLLSTPHPSAIIDYGSLIWIALQRSSNAREAIHTMTDLLDAYGFASSGESYSIVDAREGWIMDVISKGQETIGAVWVARRIPDGMVAAHANQARITTFPMDDPENCLYATDVVDFARSVGLYDGKDEDFSFANVYNAMPAHKVRYAKARVWDVYSALAGDDFADEYLDYALGLDTTSYMPLWIEPKVKVSLDEMRKRMGSHYEGTALEYGTTQAASGLFDAPYRPRPYTWQYGDKTYVNERNIGVEKTGINFIAQIRSSMPPPLRALLWFAVDDASTAPRFPAYACSTSVGKAYRGLGASQGKVRPIMKFDAGRAFWVQNMVSNFVYGRWRDAFPVLKAKLDDIHEHFVERVKQTDETALHLYRTVGRDAAVEHVTKFSVDAADWLHEQWTDFHGELFVRFRDFVTTESDPTNLACECRTTEVGMTDDWRRRIVEETGRRYEVPEEGRSDGADGGGEWRGGGRHGRTDWALVVVLFAIGGVMLLAMIIRKKRRNKRRNFERAISMEESSTLLVK